MANRQTNAADVSAVEQRTAPTPPNSRGRERRDAEKKMKSLERRKATLSEKIVASSDFAAQSTWGAELNLVTRDLAIAEAQWLALLE